MLRKTFPLLLLLAGVVALASLPRAIGEEPPAAEPPSPPFDTAEAAASALVEAFAANDDARLVAVLGPGSADFVEDGRDPIVRARRLELADEARGHLGLEPVADESGGDALYVVFGRTAWPLPIPLVKKTDGWHFDSEGAKEELLARQIGRHELDAIAFCRVYQHLQEQYFEEDRDDDGVREYAAYLFSRPGDKSGLWWASAEGEEPSPMTAALAPIQGEDDPDVDAPFAGYYWRTLRAQGPAAPGGAYSYLLNGNMIAGYALVAWPARYRQTGVMTFLVSRNGIVYEKDLGEQTGIYGRTVQLFEPDETWSPIEPGDELPAPDGAERR